MKTKIKLVLLALSLTGNAFAVSVQVNVVSTSNTFQDNVGVALSSGNPTVNGDGDLFEIGFFTDSTNLFSGEWVALTGASSNNPSLVTTIGDLASQDGNTPVPNGLVSSASLFDTEASTNNDLPAGGTQLAVRIYDGTGVAGSNYNTATSAAWVLLSPSTPTAGPVVLDFDNTDISIIWEDDENPFQTTIAIPEPSTAVLFGLGGLALMRRRRR